MKKFSLTILTAVAVLMGSNAQALPGSVSGALIGVESKHLTVINEVKSDNDKGTQICVGVACANSDSGIAITGTYVNADYAHIENRVTSSNGRDNQICVGIACTNAKR